jgi:hypothetical protein
MSWLLSYFRNMKWNKSKIKNISIASRWSHYSNGLILDSKDSNNPVWIVGSIWFETWFLGLEERLQLVLSNRLMQSSSESMENYLIRNDLDPPKNNDIDMWKELETEWHERGMGIFSLFEKEENGDIKLLINNYPNLYIAIGYLLSAWETMMCSRYKSYWNDSELSILLTLTPTSDNFPPPQPISNGVFIDGKSSLSDSSEWWEMLKIDPEGSWSISNDRKMVVSRDLFERFIKSSIPYVNDINFPRLKNYNWNSIDDLNSIWWSAAADSARAMFISESYHVMIDKTDDWKNVGYRHLQKNGLGVINKVQRYDDNGGIILHMKSLFHPSISCGILLACWERAYGRNGQLIFTNENNMYIVKIFSSLVVTPPNS